MKFVFVDTVTLRQKNYKGTLQWRAVAACYQCCTIRTANPSSRSFVYWNISTQNRP